MKKDLIFLMDRSLSVYKDKDKLFEFYRKTAGSAGYEEALITVALFSDDLQVLCLRQPEEVAEAVLKAGYYNDGSSALFDTAAEFTGVWDRYLSRTGAEETKTELYIITDGIDNASVRNTFADLSGLLQEREESGWLVELLDMQLGQLDLESMKKRGTRNGNRQ